MKSWNSVHNLAVPALLAFVDAGWVWAWLSATVNLTRGVPADVPFFALVVPAVIAVVISSATARLHTSWIYRLLLLAPVAVVEAAIAAAVIGSLYEHGAFGVLALHPWTMTGHEPAAEAAVAWDVAILAVGRGSWLGFGELNLRHAIRSLGLAGLAYVIFFIVCSVHHAHGSFHPNVGVAGTLVVVSFPIAISVVALVNERELERSALRELRSRPSLAWLGAVLVPMGIIGAVGALLALALGPVAPLIGGAVRDVVAWLAALLNRLAHWFNHHEHTTTKGRPPRIPHPTGVVPTTRVPLPVWVTVLAAVMVVVVIVLVVYFAARSITFLRQSRQLEEVDEDVVAEEKESVFSWSHLIDQLRGLLRRLFRRRRSASLEGGAVGGATTLDLGQESIRRHYLRVLVAARAAGHGRARAETALELRDRLTSVTEPEAALALGSITAEYELVRYGEAPDTEEQLVRVRQHVDVVVAHLEAPPPAE